MYFTDVFFFFKQKTAYEMRISDWSSDVCSSDLTPGMSGLRVAVVRSMHDGDPLAAPATAEAFERTVAALQRSEERRVGTECVSTCRSRGSPCPYNKTTQNNTE